MECAKCRITGKTLFKQYCNGCFTGLIEKRAKKELAAAGWPEKDNKLLVIDDNTVDAKVTFHILQTLLKEFPCQITSSEKEEPADIIIVPCNAEQEVQDFLEQVLEKKNPSITKNVKLLKHVLSEEIEHYAKLKNLEGTKREKTKRQELIDNLEKRYPGTKFSILNSAKQD